MPSTLRTLPHDDRHYSSVGARAPGVARVERPRGARRVRRAAAWPIAIALIAILALAGGGMMIWLGDDARADNISENATFAVQRGPLLISVTESGTIQALEQEIIKNELEGTTTIITLVPEGTRVKEGDLLIELDGSNLEDERIEQEMRVQNADAAFVRARESLSVTRNQSESDIAKAELAARFAEEDLHQYIEGEFPKLLKEAEAKITLGKEELERAAEKYKWSQRLFDEQYISQSELEADRLTRNRTQLDYELAVTSRDLLKDYTYKRKLAELESDLEQADAALEREHSRTRADIVQAEADLKAKELELSRQKSKMTKLVDQLTKTKLYAPTDGMVVYASSAQRSRRGNNEPLEAGQQVRERQELIYLPTADSMMAEIKVHESALDKIAVDMPVRITVEALPGQTFTGRVARIAPLPDAQNMWLNPDLTVYATEIHLTGNSEGVRTGMSCRAQIIVDQLKDVTYVPVQAVTRIGNQRVVYVATPQGVEQRDVKIGLDNNQFVHVLDGLEEGERVLLAPPLRGGDDRSQPATTDDNSGGEAGDNAGNNATQNNTDGPASDASPQAEAPTTASPDAAGNASTPQADPSPSSEPSPGEAGDQQAGGSWQERIANMTPEQREAMRKQRENMSEEEKQQWRDRLSAGGGAGGGGAAGGFGGGDRQ